MGNRAVITASKSKTQGVGIYLHWNGGLESVLAFLDAARERQYRSPGSDPSYAMARMTGLIHEFFGRGSSTCLGIGQIKELDVDNGDNGVYVIGGNWQIIDRWGEGSTADKDISSFDARQMEQYKGIKDSLAIPDEEKEGL